MGNGRCSRVGYRNPEQLFREAASCLANEVVAIGWHGHDPLL